MTYSGRHNHALTAVNAPEMPQSEAVRQKQARHDAKVEILRHIHALVGGQLDESSWEHSVPNLKRQSNNLLNPGDLSIEAACGWKGDRVSIGIGNLTPEQGLKVARFIADELL
jgi:hypothetical protein